MDRSTLVVQPSNDQNPFILEPVIQHIAPSLEHLVTSDTNTEMAPTHIFRENTHFDSGEQHEQSLYMCFHVRILLFL